MPNHVINQLTFGCSDKQFYDIMYDVTSEDDSGIRFFDFRKLIPVPESLMIEEGGRAEKAFRLALNLASEPNRIEAINRIKNLRSGEEYIDYILEKNNMLTQMSDEEIATVKKEAGDEYDDFLNLGNTALRNFLDYGYRSWYGWCRNIWGTKWNAYDYECKEKEHQIRFQTAWSAPDPVILALSARYPNVAIEHCYADEDIGENIGCNRYLSGKMISNYNAIYYEEDSRNKRIAFALELWYDDPEQHGYSKAADGKSYVYLYDDEYEVVEFLDKTMLFTNERLFLSDIPNGWHKYDLVESNEEGRRFSAVRDFSILNHGGTLVSLYPIDLGDDPFGLELTEDMEPNFLGETMTFWDYLKER